MVELLSLVAFSIVSLVLGLVALFYTDKIPFWVGKITRQRKGLSKFINPTQTRWSIKFGGLIALLIGLFVLWMSWHNCTIQKY